MITLVYCDYLSLLWLPYFFDQTPRLLFFRCSFFLVFVVVVVFFFSAIVQERLLFEGSVYFLRNPQTPPMAG